MTRKIVKRYHFLLLATTSACPRPHVCRTCIVHYCKYFLVESDNAPVFFVDFLEFELLVVEKHIGDRDGLGKENPREEWLGCWKRESTLAVALIWVHSC